MKKFFISAVLATAMIFSANAQFWVGSSLGFDSNSKTTPIGFDTSSSSFVFAPEFGYSLDDRWSFGLGLGFGTTGFTIGDGDRQSASSFAVAPFAQYVILQQGRFILLCRATVGFQHYSGFALTGTGATPTFNDDLSINGFFANVTPFVHYVVSDRFNVFAGLNFLSIDFSHLSGSNDGDDTGNLTTFNFGVDSNNLFNTGNFQIGFIFKF